MTEDKKLNVPVQLPELSTLQAALVVNAFAFTIATIASDNKGAADIFRTVFAQAQSLPDGKVQEVMDKLVESVQAQHPTIPTSYIDYDGRPIDRKNMS